MSKLLLKKELATLTREQLTEVILSAYSANKTIKEYFDFFITPDVEKLYEKHKAAITKEILRGKYHQSTARISRIRKSIKDFASFGPGPEKVCKLRLYAIEMLIMQELNKNYSATLINGTVNLVFDTLAYADRNLMFDAVMKQIETLTAPITGRGKYFRNFIRSQMQLPEGHI